MRVAVALCAVFLATLVVARPQEPELDNDVIPRDPQVSQPLPSVEPQSSTTVEVTTTTTTTSDKATPPKPSDFFTRLVDDFIQIPIAALRAVNQLLNNLTIRTRSQTTTTTTVAPAVTTSSS